jgi:hypothetical protein
MKWFDKALLAASMAALAPLNASAALTWSYDWASADALVGASGTRPLSNPTDEVKFTVESVVRFIDNDMNSHISAGDTFIDYIVLRFDQLLLAGSDNGETNAGYGGPRASGSRQITLTTVLSGIQTGTDSYTVNPGGTIDFIYDAGAGYTEADFAALNTFNDSNGGPGRAVQTGRVVAPSAGLNNSPTIPDGKIDLTVLLENTLMPGGFEVAAQGGALAGLRFGLFDADNAVCADSGGAAACVSSADKILSFFKAPNMGANQFEFHTRSERSMTMILGVPEPGGLALLGAALLGWGAVQRRRGH